MTTKCHQCGMFCSPTEFHPFAACLMFMGCHDSDKVRANLAALTATQATKAGEFDEHAWKWESEAGFTGLTDEQCNDLARQHTVFNGSHAMTNYVSLINAVIDLCTRDEAPLRSAPASGAVGEAIGWQFRFVFPTHASNWKSVLELPMTDMKGGDGFHYETRLVFAGQPAAGDKA